MNRIRFMLEYNSSPIWIYQDNELLDNGLPEEFASDAELVALIAKITETFDSLFENTSISFEYKGFPNNLEKNKFVSMVEQGIILLKNKMGNKYDVVIDFNSSIL